MKRKGFLNAELAGIFATLKHGEMVFIADAGSAHSKKSLYPIADDVEYYNIGQVIGVPTVEDIVKTAVEIGNIEGAVLPYGIDELNPEFHAMICDSVGEENLHEINYAPEFYDLRNRCKAVIQTGDYGFGCNVILVGGFSPDARWSIDVLEGRTKYIINKEEAFNMPIDEFNEKYRK